MRHDNLQFSITTFKDTFIGLISQPGWNGYRNRGSVISENSFMYQNLFWYLEVYKKAEFFKLIMPSLTQALLLLARASLRLSMKVKVLNAKFSSKLRFRLLKKLIPKKSAWSFYIFTVLRLEPYKPIHQLSSFSVLFLALN